MGDDADASAVTAELIRADINVSLESFAAVSILRSAGFFFIMHLQSVTVYVSPKRYWLVPQFYTDTIDFLIS